MNFYTHVDVQVLKPIQHPLYTNRIVFGLFIAQKVKLEHAAFSTVFIEDGKLTSLTSVRICGPSKIPPFNFSSLSEGNVEQMYLNHSPSLSNAFTNCFIKPSFM